MAIKIGFLTGETEKRTSSLYQWDYGQTLEIESLDLPTLIEVHFACPNMKEAIVHPCSVTNGVATVAIPNRCLEQADTITAWVYEINGTTGCTTKTIHIPVIARTRPGRGDEIPQDVSDQYTELITEVNEAVGSITSGDLMVGRAARATSADRATEASNAASATTAISAETAKSASKAQYLESGDGTKFGRNTLWKNQSPIYAESADGFMKANTFRSLNLSSVAESISMKWIMANISKLYVYNSVGGVDLLAQAHVFKTCPFYFVKEGESYAFSQEIDGATFTFYVSGSNLYYKSSAEGYFLTAIYEEL